MPKSLIIGALAVSLAGAFVGCPVFADGPVDISIVEMVNDGNGNFTPWQDITGAMPGETYSAIPRIKNDGVSPVEVSMCLSESISYATGETYTLTSNVFEIETNPHWILDSEAAYSNYASGNCYKYNSVIDTGDASEPLFEEVKLSSSLGNEYKGATFTLHLDAVAISSGDIPPSGVPDTGENTATYFENVSPVFYTAGILACIAMVSFLLRRLLRK